MHYINKIDIDIDPSAAVAGVSGTYPLGDGEDSLQGVSSGLVRRSGLEGNGTYASAPEECVCIHDNPCVNCYERATVPRLVG